MSFCEEVLIRQFLDTAILRFCDLSGFSPKISSTLLSHVAAGADETIGVMSRVMVGVSPNWALSGTLISLNHPHSQIFGAASSHSVLVTYKPQRNK